MVPKAFRPLSSAVFTFLGEYKIFIIECVENIGNITSAHTFDVSYGGKVLHVLIISFGLRFNLF